MAVEGRRAGWDWFANLLGPFWYFSKGMAGKGLWLLLVCMVTLGLGAPFVWIYCGAKARSDYFEYQLRKKNRYDVNEL